MRYRILPACLLLAAALFLTACGRDADSAPALEPTASGAPVGGQVGAQQTVAPTPAPTPMPTPTPTPEPTAAPAQTAGERVASFDYDYMLMDADGASGWFVVSWMSKGYGTKWLAVNPELGLEIEGEEGAEVVLCPGNIIQFQWRDAGGNKVSAGDMFYYEDDDPQEMTLYAVIYDLSGTVTEEREVLKLTQSADDPYYSTVYPAMESIVNALGGRLLGSMSMLSAGDENGDAVVKDASGAELLRIPGCDATMTYVFSADGGSHVSVYRPDINKTEIYRFGD